MRLNADDHAPGVLDLSAERTFYCSESGELDIDARLHIDDYADLLRWRDAHAMRVSLRFGVIAFFVGCAASTIIALAAR